MFDVKLDLQPTINSLTQIQRKQLPYATSLALNRSAFDALRDLQQQIPSIFDRPIPFTVAGWYVQKSNKNNLYAAVATKEWASKGTSAAKYLTHHITGGSRKPKRSEILLRNRGIIKPGSFVVPAHGTPMDKYGNIQKQQMVKMLSAVGATQDELQRTKKGKRPKFIVYRGPRRTVIYKLMDRIGGRDILLPFLVEVSKVGYRAIFDPKRIIDTKVRTVFQTHFEKALAEALASAK